MTKAFYDENGRALPIFRPQATTTTAYTGAAGTSAAVAAGVRLVRVYCTSDAFVVVGDGVTADSGDMPITADVAEYIPVNEGDVVSAIQQTAGGNMHVTALL